MSFLPYQAIEIESVRQQLMLRANAFFVDRYVVQRYDLGWMEFPRITEPILRQFVEASAEMSARIVGIDNAFRVLVRVGSSEKTVITTRGGIRLFATLDTAAGFIKDLGLSRFEVDISFYKPGRLRNARPDRAEALRNTRTRMYQQPLGLEI